MNMNMLVSRRKTHSIYSEWASKHLLSSNIAAMSARSSRMLKLREREMIVDNSQCQEDNQEDQPDVSDGEASDGVADECHYIQLWTYFCILRRYINCTRSTSSINI